MAEQPQDTYNVKETCLCYHGDLIYEARILDIRNDVEPTRYMVHYKGWKKGWDELVGYERLMKKTPENLQLQKMIQKKAEDSAGNIRARRGSSIIQKRPRDGPSTQSASTRGVKRPREEETEDIDIEMRLTVPDVLKLVLVDDFERVTKDSQLVSLPRKPSAEEVLAEFEEYVVSTKPDSLRDPDLLAHTVVTGLRIYFDRTLGNQLLYLGERPQFAEVRKQYITGQQVKIGESVEMSAVYGAEHLLRMLVIMPNLIALTKLDSESIGLIQDYIDELLRWMEREKDRILLTEYSHNSAPRHNVNRSDTG